MATATLNSEMKTFPGRPADLDVHYEGKGCDKAHSPPFTGRSASKKCIDSRVQVPKPGARGGDHAKRDQLPRATQILADFDLVLLGGGV